MVFKKGDRVQIDQNYDRKRFNAFGPIAEYYRNRTGIIIEVNERQVALNNGNYMCKVMWESGNMPEHLNKLLIYADEKYKSIW